jgi:hypothetical protein
VKVVVNLLIAFIGFAFVSAGLTSSRENFTHPSPPTNSFTFTAAGDYGFGSDITATLKLIPRLQPDFHLALGDLKYENPLSESQWCDYVKSNVGEKFPFLLISGNHEDDYGKDGHITNFAKCLPDRIGVTGDYARQFYFDYRGLARFILISPDLTINEKHYYYGDNNANYQWVAETIDEARSAGIPWVIVGMHKSCLSMGEYYCHIYADLFNLLIDKKVDLVLQAHEHSYQRSKQLAASPGCPAVPIDSFNPRCVVDDGKDNKYTKGLGTVFVIAGTAGVPLYKIKTDDSEAGYFAKWMGANIKPRKGLMKFTASDKQVAGEFVGSTGTSNFSDKFTISKSGR